MASETQIAANRRNARKSTGPKSADGKAAIARNALRHGLTAEQVVLFDEAGTDFAAYHAELRAALDPADAVDEALVERIVLCAWRLRRVGRAEAGVINASADKFRRHGEKVEFGRVFSLAVEDVAAVSRHEAAIDRALRRAHVLLERRQARRRGEAVPPPITVDVDGLTAAEDGPAAPSANIKICKTKPISESALHSNPLPAGGEREGPASAGG